MAKNNVSELDVVAANNADIAGVSILGTGLLSTADDSFRNTASFLAKWWDDIGGVNTVAGTGDAITVTTPTVYTALKTGMRLQFIAGAANTTAATLNLDAIGAKALRKISGGADVALVAGDIPGNKFRVDVGYDAAANSAAGAWIVLGAAPVAAATTSASGIVELATVAEALTGTDAVRAVTPAGLYYPTGHLFGLTLSNNSGTPLTKIDIAAGDCRDSTDTGNMALAAALTAKDGTAAWAVGASAGCLDTGAIANSTWYHGWLIKRVDTGVVDFLISTSATAPTMPTNYTLKRRIGSPFFTNGSAQFRAFIQIGNDFLWSAVASDISATNPGTSAVSRTLTVPTGIKVKAKVNVVFRSDASSSAVAYLSSLDQSDDTPLFSNGISTVAGVNNSTIPSAGTAEIWTNTSGQIRSRSSASNATTNLYIGTNGWTDPRV